MKDKKKYLEGMLRINTNGRYTLYNYEYQRISIGVDTSDTANIRLYKRLGFTIKVKECTEDPCDRDENMQPRSCPCFWLLYKEI